MCRLLPLSKRLNDLAQGCQGQIDGFQLKQVLLIHGAFFLANLFATSQVTEVKFTPEQHPSRVSLVTFNEQLENSVAAWRVYVSFGLPGNPILLAPFQQYIAVLSTVNHVFAKSYYEDPRDFIFTYNQRLVLSTILEQIIELLIVNLEEWTVNSEAKLRVLLVLGCQLFENLLNGFRNDPEFATVHQEITRAHRILVTIIVVPMGSKHRIGLSWTCLTVCKYCRIETSDYIFDTIYLNKGLMAMNAYL